MSRAKRVVIATSNQYIMKYWIEFLEEGYEASATSNAESFMRMLRSGQVDVAVVFGGRMFNYERLPNVGEARNGTLAGWAAVRQARREGHQVPAVFVRTLFNSPDLTGFVVVDGSDLKIGQSEEEPFQALTEAVKQALAAV